MHDGLTTEAMVWGVTLLITGGMLSLITWILSDMRTDLKAMAQHLATLNGRVCKTETRLEAHVETDQREQDRVDEVLRNLYCQTAGSCVKPK